MKAITVHQPFTKIIIESPTSEGHGPPGQLDFVLGFMWASTFSNGKMMSKIKVDKQGYPVVDPAFPKTDAEESLCALVLALVGACDGIGYDRLAAATLFVIRTLPIIKMVAKDYVDSLGRRYWASVLTLKVTGDDVYEWVLAREYLCLAKAITLDDSERGPIYGIGPAFDGIKYSLPAFPEDFGKMVFEAIKEAEALNPKRVNTCPMGGKP